MTRSRAKGKASVLARQKPRRTLGRGFRKLFYEHGKSLAITALIATILIFSASHLMQTYSAVASWWEKPRPSIPWKVDLRLDSDVALADRRVQEIMRSARESLGQGDSESLERTVQRLRSVEAFGMVRVARLAWDRVIVHVVPRRPIMCAEADRLRLVAETGEIYGVAGVEGSAPCEGPLLRGIPEPGRKASLNADLTLKLDAEEEQAVLDAIALYQTAKAQNLRLATISYNRYRGFNATLSANETDITFGRSPFDDKINKLRSILSGLEHKGETASRIELDYQGKAFVKLRKL